MIRRQRTLQRWIVLLMVGLYCCYGNAANYQSLASIQATITDHMLDRYQHDDKLSIQVGFLDPRLRLHQCQEALSVTLPSHYQHQRNVTLQVVCSAVPTWKIYVSVVVKRSEAIVVAARALSKGQTITTDDVQFEQRDTFSVQKRYYKKVDELLGKTLKRSIAAGAIMTPGLLQRAVLVRRGDRVVIIAQKKGMRVAMQGQALQSGYRGQQIQVRNMKSRKVIDGTVVAAGEVQVIVG